ncbi:dehydrogenase [Oryctes borbonicus]|uniref:Dehydrogenase n=1 Tax=Oryctes borbonicus TaxID=1629725 RepID=A0A0T6B216_9SCAR|nr:dehydrogenase [Oryctes borbonicus]
MVAQKEYSLLKSTIDVIAFLLIAAVHIACSIVKALIPDAYRSQKSIKDEVVVITGGGGGLGRLLALRLSTLNAIVVLWDVNEDALKETVRHVEEQGGKAYAYKCDITNREDVYKTAERTAREVGQVSILINNAGVVSGYLLLDTPDHLIQRTFEVNAISHFWTTKAFLPKMIENSNGHIITVSSMAGHTGTAKLVDYCSSKFAAVGFDEALRVELESLGVNGVKTTLVCPYFIQSTGMFTDVQTRFIRILKSSEVADRIITGILREEVHVFIPSIFRYTFWTKWIFPWSIVSMYLRNIVIDVAPTHKSRIQRKVSAYNVEKIKANIMNSSNDAHCISANGRKL